MVGMRLCSSIPGAAVPCNRLSFGLVHQAFDPPLHCSILFEEWGIERFRNLDWRERHVSTMQPPAVKCGDDSEGTKKHDSSSTGGERVIGTEDNDDLFLADFHCLVFAEGTVFAARLHQGIAFHGPVRYLFSAALHCSPEGELPDSSDDIWHGIWPDHVIVCEYLL